MTLLVEVFCDGFPSSNSLLKDCCNFACCRCRCDAGDGYFEASSGDRSRGDHDPENEPDMEANKCRASGTYDPIETPLAPNMTVSNSSEERSEWRASDVGAFIVCYLTDSSAEQRSLMKRTNRNCSLSLETSNLVQMYHPILSLSRSGALRNVGPGTLECSKALVCVCVSSLFVQTTDEDGGRRCGT